MPSDPNLAERVREGLARAEQASMSLARQGWTTPYWFQPRDSWELLGSGDPDEVDAAFVDYYSVNDGEMYERISAPLQHHPALAPWHELLGQADVAYRRGDYAVVVPAAFVALEGVLMREQGRSTKVVAATREKVPQGRAKHSIPRWMWTAVLFSVEELYRQSDFTDQRPPVLNRHWILHGRDASTWTQADCLRLLQACVVVAQLESQNPV